MKKIIALFLFLTMFVFGDDIIKEYGYLNNYEIALKKAKEEKKDIVLVLVSDYCPWCDRLKKEVLSLEYTTELLQEYYIPLILNNSVDMYPDKFSSRIVPAIHFISYKDESIIETVVGFNNNYRFYEIIEKNKK